MKPKVVIIMKTNAGKEIKLHRAERNSKLLEEIQSSVSMLSSRQN